MKRLFTAALLVGICGYPMPAAAQRFDEMGADEVLARMYETYASMLQGRIALMEASLS